MSQDKQTITIKSNDALEAFLREHNAKMLWILTKTGGFTVSGYSANGRIFIIQQWNDGNGWEIYIPASDKNSVGATLHNTAFYLKNGIK